MWVAREYFEKGDKLKTEQHELQNKVSSLQAQLEQAKSHAEAFNNKEEVYRLQKVIQVGYSSRHTHQVDIFAGLV